jgi:uncharacterized membrane protein
MVERTGASVEQEARKSKNHLIWIGVLVSLVGLISYFTVFARFPATRDIPWVNLPLVFVGLVLSLLAVRRRASIFSVTGLLLSAACAVLLSGYVFILSEQLPEVERVVALGAEAPAFTLIDDTGSAVSLADFRGAPVVLVFYRGFW